MLILWYSHLFQVKDAELSWLDSRILLRKVITEAQNEFENEKENVTDDVEMENADSEVNKRLCSIKVDSETYCLEPIISSNIPPHQVNKHLLKIF